MIKRAVKLIALFLLCITLHSQPGDPPPDPGGDDPIGGGSVPIGSGVSILSILSVGYLLTKIYKSRSRLIE